MAEIWQRTQKEWIKTLWKAYKPPAGGAGQASPSGPGSNNGELGVASGRCRPVTAWSSLRPARRAPRRAPPRSHRYKDYCGYIHTVPEDRTIVHLVSDSVTSV